MYIASSSFIVQDMTGIQVFNPEGFFVSRVWRSHKPWECFGLAEDEQRRLWFIDFNWRSKETHLKCYDLKEEKPVKGISLKELVGDRSRESKCRFLTFSKGKLYITDLGLDQVYILDPNNLESFRKFGSSGAGDGQFNDPAGVVVDDVGNILVADSRNHRLCLHDKNGKWMKNQPVMNLILLVLLNQNLSQDGVMRVRRPSALLLDRKRGELYCLNLQGSEAVVKYRASL